MLIPIVRSPKTVSIFHVAGFVRGHKDYILGDSPFFVAFAAIVIATADSFAGLSMCQLVLRFAFWVLSFAWSFGRAGTLGNLVSGLA